VIQSIAPNRQLANLEVGIRARIKRVITIRQRRALLSNHALFDAAWYLETYRDVAGFSRDPLTHYLLHGAVEGRATSPLFDGHWYLDKYPDVAAAKIDPLTHYLLYGVMEKRDPNPLFDTSWYLNQNPDVAGSGLDPLTHYLKIGSKKGRSPSPLFDLDWYVEKNPDIAASGMDALSHYFRRNTKEKRTPNLLFDPVWYLQCNLDVAHSKEDPLAHYLRCGRRERRSPSPLFDAPWYLEEYSDVARSGLEPIVHYILHGEKENRDPNPFFDAQWYVDRYPEVVASGLGPLAHYIRRGEAKGYHPNPMFDAKWYAQQNPDIARTGLNPLAHYIHFGVAEGRKPAPIFERSFEVELDKSISGPFYTETRLKTCVSRVAHPLRIEFSGLDPSEANIRAQRNGRVWRRPVRELLVDRNAFIVAPPRGAELWLELRNREAGCVNPLPDSIKVRVLTTSEAQTLFPRDASKGALSGFELAPVDFYRNWRDLYDIFDSREHRLATKYIARLPFKPLFSIIVPVYNTEESALREMLASVKKQVYQNWQLCLADDASTFPHVRSILEAAALSDQRITIQFRTKNGHISAASNSALELASGDYVALLDHDDCLAPYALALIAHAINEHPDAEIFYSDEDHIDASGEHRNPYFKPDWNPELLLGQNYVNHLVVYKRDLVRAIGGFRLGFEGSQDYDLILRSSRETKGPIIHVPHVLYHWRAYQGSQTFSATNLDRATGAARKAIKERLAADGQIVNVTEGCAAGYHRVIDLSPIDWPRVSVIIPTRDHVELLREVVGGLLEKTDYTDLEIIIANNDSVERETLAYFEEIEPKGVIVFSAPGPFNFSKINNDASRIATGEILLFLNNDISVLQRGWLKEMVRHARKADVGAVGAKLLYPDGTLQHGGVVLGIGGVAGHLHCGAGPDDHGYFSRLALTQEVACVTAACLAMQRHLFERLGGFNEEDVKIAFNDVDLCVRIRQAGYRIIWTPFAQLVHHESKSRGSDVAPERRERFQREEAYMRAKWGPVLDADPFYSPNLSLKSVMAEYALPPRTKLPWSDLKSDDKKQSFAGRMQPVAARMAGFLRTCTWLVGG
jgi:GT2 family glycosyltransferase